MQRNYRGAMACDVSCGDRRNLTVLHTLGMKLHGTEVSADICDHTMRKLRASPERVEANIRPGLNWAIPFADGSFQRARIADDCFGIALDYFVFVCQRQG
jgi:hypothetical protein